MKFGVVNKSTILNRFVPHTSQFNITHLAIIARKSSIKLSILKGGNWKRARLFLENGALFRTIRKCGSFSYPPPITPTHTNMNFMV